MEFDDELDDIDETGDIVPFSDFRTTMTSTGPIVEGRSGDNWVE